jgi:CheY-like chemotaxis protein/CheY-specific phosphatase CheX
MVMTSGPASTANERPSVLLVDDEPTGRRLLKRWIERCFDGHVVEAANGLEALEVLAAEHFDLVVLDLMMPVLDGTETLSLIRSDPNHGDIEVVVASQLASEQKVKDVISLGVADYILKPLRYESVVDRLRQIIDRARQKKRERQQNSDRSCVLVADPDPNFCDFASSALSVRFRCFAVRTAAEALVATLKSNPNLILISEGLPGLPFDVLCHKLTSLANAAETKVYLLRDVASREPDSRFAGEMIRTFVPETFVARVNQLLGGTAAGDGPEFWLQALEPEVVSAVRQALGMMTGFEPATLAQLPGSFEADLFGAIGLEAESGDLHLRVELDSRRDFAVELCTSMLGGGASDVDDELLMSGVGEILNVVGGRIKNSFSNRKIDVLLGLPRLGSSAQEASGVFYRWQQSFAWREKHSFQLRILAHAAQPAGAAPGAPLSASSSASSSAQQAAGTAASEASLPPAAPKTVEAGGESAAPEAALPAS